MKDSVPEKTKETWGYIIFDDNTDDVENFEAGFTEEKVREILAKDAPYYLGKWRGDNHEWKFAIMKMEVYG